MERAKMIKTAKGLGTFFHVIQKILTVLLAVMLIAMIVMTVMVKVNPDAVIGEEFHLMELGMLTFGLAEGCLPDNATVLKITWATMIPVALNGIVMIYIMGQLRRMMKLMEEGTPFCEATCDCLKKLSWASLILGVMSNVSNAVSTQLVMDIYNAQELLVGGNIVSLTANTSIDLTFIVAFFILLLMQYIFRYGTKLQQLSDETV